MKSRATTPEAYVKALPADRREAMAAVRAVILKNLPKGDEEVLDFGMLAYVVPLRRFPDTYNGRPLMVAALASQKHYLSVYLMGVYESAALRKWFTSQCQKSGRKHDLGKCCVRFRKAEDLPLEVVGEAIARVSVENCLKLYRKSRKGRA